MEKLGSICSPEIDDKIWKLECLKIFLAKIWAAFSPSLNDDMSKIE